MTVTSKIVRAHTRCGVRGCLALIYPAKGKDVKSPVDNLQGGGQLYYIETIYHPRFIKKERITSCILVSSGGNFAGVLYSDEVDTACYIETV